MRFLSVSEITSQIKTTISLHFGYLCVEGEVSNLTKHQSGHCYFSLKDDNASIKCVLFRGNEGAKILDNNIKVQVEGTLSVYENRGEYQIICKKVNKAGIGNLAEQYEKLKAKLKEKGYFESKKPLPKFPKKIALLTSKTGAALQDMKFVANKRWNLAHFTIIDTLVQGNEAKNIIARNIAFADNCGFDIIVLARGGGSIEDLWAFNEEIVADSIFAAKTPIVSAVGHESDFVLSDFVADLRAPTPSACMEMILPDKNEWLLRLDDIRGKLNAVQSRNLEQYKKELNFLQEKLALFKFDYKRLKEAQNELGAHLKSAFKRFLDTKKESALNVESAFRASFSQKCTQKSQNLESIKSQLHIVMAHFIQNKINLALKQIALDSAFGVFLAQKERNLTHTMELLEAKKIKKGFIEITLNNKIISLEELKNGDKIVISNGEISKNAIILDS